MEIAIRIWMRDDVPDDISTTIQGFDNEEEQVVCALHLPQHVMDHPLFELANGLSADPHATAILDPRFRWLFLQGLFASNGYVVHDHPDGDGLILVCYNV